MIALSVNLNKIALIRNSREGNFPDVVTHARTCLDAGAQGITVHPRPDQRHIRPGDVRELAALCGNRHGIEFNVEGNPFAAHQGDYPGLMELVLETQPDQCTLVPDNNDQLTSDHGFNLKLDGPRLVPVIAKLKDAGIRVSLFMDPDQEQISLAKDVGADRIELYTGPYAEAVAKQSPEMEDIFNTHCAAAEHARHLGLGVNAGHDLNLVNLPRYRALPGLQEVSIGHALTVDAIAMGLENAVKAYLDCLAGK
ncbi:pyridoxine 5'-phosphate synthase [Microbulbifer echini]|uniref:Pyridoxine 5'-phosphate synthase n=1 Tax=Microbulbifer echini TaxID=1529067 RepID=A0ABV4NPN5_9GAMM|nr:pyridoxine 5'-phosphate synthase [uncultured Microbulbifer sp.]